MPFGEGWEVEFEFDKRLESIPGLTVEEKKELKILWLGVPPGDAEEFLWGSPEDQLEEERLYQKEFLRDPKAPGEWVKLKRMKEIIEGARKRDSNS